MDKESIKNVSGGVGFFGLLTIAFIVLKLCKIIEWSWMWVLSPLWIPLSLCIIGGGIFLLWLIEPFEKERKK